jgi:hypothetical protein
VCESTITYRIDEACLADIRFSEDDNMANHIVWTARLVKIMRCVYGGLLFMDWA